MGGVSNDKSSQDQQKTQAQTQGRKIKKNVSNCAFKREMYIRYMFLLAWNLD